MPPANAELCQRSCGNMGKVEPEALIDVSHACICCQVFLSLGRRNLNQAGPRFERGRKIVLMLHDDFQHLGQTRGMITIAERQPVNWSTGWSSRHPVFTNQAPFSASCQPPNLQIREATSGSIFDLDQASLRRVKEILPTQYHRTFQNAVHLNSYYWRSTWDTLHSISFP